MRKISALLCLTIVFLFIATSTVLSKTGNDISVLQNCRSVYSETNSEGAYLYGYTINCLYSAKILPEVNIRKLEVTGKIRSVTQYKSKTCALIEFSSNNYNVVVMDNISGSCNYYEFKSFNSLRESSFAFEGDKVYFIRTDSVYSYVQCYSLNGDLLRTYKPDNEVTGVFVNNSKVYFNLYNGEIYRINSNSYEYVAKTDSNATFTSAGAGWIYSSKNELISLEGNQNKTVANGSKNCVTYINNKIISSDGKTLYINDESVSEVEGEAEFILSFKDKYSVIRNDFVCTTDDIPTVTKANEQNDNGDGSSDDSNTKKSYKVNSDGILYGVESGTTVSLFKQTEGIGNVYDENGKAITSGKIKTGYSADVNGVKRLISVRGDITGEGNVKSNDVSALMSGLTEKTTLSKVQSVSADYNFDGKVNNKDLVLIARKAGM